MAQPPADQAARGLIAELGRGRKPEPRLRKLLEEMLGEGPTAVVSPANPSRAVAEWMVATPEERGKALEDLLLLVDALPTDRRKSRALHFPRLESRPA